MGEKIEEKQENECGKGDRVWEDRLKGKMDGGSEDK